MKLITNEQQAQLRANGLAAGEALSRGSDIDPMPVVKLFTPDADIIWLITELNAYGGDRAYGLCELGDGYPGIGFSIYSNWNIPNVGLTSCAMSISSPISPSLPTSET